MAEWIETYGVWAVLAGAVLEGEAVLIAAGYAVSQGYISGGPVLLAAALGATLGDHGWFTIGRLWGEPFIRRIPAVRRLHRRAAVWAQRWGRGAAFGLRFAYGLRTVIPLSLGAARFSRLNFFLLNALGAVAFAVVYLSLGFFFGEAAERVFAHVRARAPQVMVGVVLVGLGVWGVHEWRIFRGRSSDDPPPGEGDEG